MNVENTFPLISDEISLNLINTEVVRHGKRHDLLHAVEDVVGWVTIQQEKNYFYKQQYNFY